MVEKGGSEIDEVKGVALNLTHSPEKFSVWEHADPFIPGAGHVVSTLLTSAKPSPRGRRQHRVYQRQASNQASATSKVPLGNQPQW